MKKILSVVLAAVISIAYLAPISSIDTKAESVQTSDSSYAAQFIETVGGATVEEATLEEGKATFTVTIPDGGWVQFMQKLSITDNNDTSL